MNNMDPAPTADLLPAAKRVQPDSPLSGEVQRGGTGGFIYKSPADLPLARGGWPDWSAVFAPLGYNTPSGPADRRLSDRRSLYFIQCDDFVKVGIAFDVGRRLEDLRIGDPYGRLRLHTKWWLPALFARQIERRVHAVLDAHAAGREWFLMPVGDAMALAKPVVEHGRAVYAYAKRLGFWDERS